MDIHDCSITSLAWKRSAWNRDKILPKVHKTKKYLGRAHYYVDVTWCTVLILYGGGRIFSAQCYSSHRRAEPAGKVRNNWTKLKTCSSFHLYTFRLFLRTMKGETLHTSTVQWFMYRQTEKTTALLHRLPRPCRVPCTIYYGTWIRWLLDRATHVCAAVNRTLPAKFSPPPHPTHNLFAEQVHPYIKMLLKSRRVMRLWSEGWQSRWRFDTLWMIKFGTEILCWILIPWFSSSKHRLSICIPHQAG